MSAGPVLVLFDLDLTLVSTHAAGMESMVLGGRGLHGDAFSADGVSFAGRLDPLIVVDLLRSNALEPTPSRVAEFRDAYERALRARFERGPLPEILPGVEALLARLGALDTVVLGLLTGNYEQTGRLKLAASGLDADAFVVRVWGDESPHDTPAREHLPPIAIERAEALGYALPPDRVLVIGDTPYDVACARANGCRSLGVATGRTPVEELAAAGATRAVADLSDTEDVLAWILRSE